MQHGFPDRETTFEDFQVLFGKVVHNFITPTLRGYPPSSVPPNQEDYSIALLLSDLVAILENKDANKVTLFAP